MCVTYLMPAVCLCCFCCLSLTVVWELLKGDRSGWRARPAALQGALREMCWALSQRGSHPQRTFAASHSQIPKRKLQPFEQGLQMFYSAGKRAFVNIFCACTLVCGCGTTHFHSHPSFSPFTVRGSGIKPYCFYSISCHYQRQFDY